MPKVTMAQSANAGTSARAHEKELLLTWQLARPWMHVESAKRLSA